MRTFHAPNQALMAAPRDEVAQPSSNENAERQTEGKGAPTPRREHANERGGEFPSAIIGSSAIMWRVLRTIRQLGNSKTTVLIQGESGTGKELVARAIHGSGVTARGPFVAFNCGGVSRSLLESQLFGHVKGAFTNAYADAPGYFRAADGGTLLLDEIIELEADIQAKLLRVLQEREVTPVGATEPIPLNVRIVAATNRPLEPALRSGRLREDLYYRLRVVVIRLPPLRERKSDIPELVQYFNTRFSHSFGVAPKPISPQALARFAAYDWPGNIRELENIIRRAFALAEPQLVLPEDFSGDIPAAPCWPDPMGAVASTPGAASDGSGRVHADLMDGSLPTWEEAEKILLAEAMKRSGGVKSKAANMLKIERRRLSRLLKKYQMG